MSKEQYWAKQTLQPNNGLLGIINQGQLGESGVGFAEGFRQVTLAHLMQATCVSCHTSRLEPGAASIRPARPEVQLCAAERRVCVPM